MIPLGKDLDTTNFDTLLALAKSRLPALAKQWTDFNYHDPGIMLIELMAWLADSQIYSLARNRKDERLGFLRLMGSRVRGTRPAKGLVFPAKPPDAERAINYGAILKEASGSAPRLEADAAITLLPIGIKRISTLSEGGIADVTEISARSRAAFSPFGADGKGVLKIELATDTVAAGSRPVLLSLGFRLNDNAPDGIVQGFTRVGAFREDGTRLRRVHDTTCALQRSGAMIFALDAAELKEPIVLRVERGRSLGLRLLDIAPNALPVEQRAHFMYDDARGNGRPGQTIEIAPAALFPADEALKGRIWRLVDGAASLTVSNWTRGRLDDAAPTDNCYSVEEAIDGSRIALRFGNGVNGRRPDLDEAISISVTLSCGRMGGVVQPTDWITTPTGTRWRNAEPIAGGVDARSPDEALGDLRLRLTERRPLATSEQIERAALTLPPTLGILRAHVEEGWERGRRAPGTPATRTLVVASVVPGSETQAWLDAIRRQLVPRIATGERLLIVAPVYRRFALAIGIVAATGTRPTGVAEDVRKELAARLDPMRNLWPFGRDVSAAVIAGWVRRLPGVARVSGVALRPGDGGASVPLIAVGRGELPLLLGDPVVTAESAPR